MKSIVKISLSVLCIFVLMFSLCCVRLVKADSKFPSFFKKIFGKYSRKLLADAMDATYFECDVVTEALIDALGAEDKENFIALFASDVSGKQGFKEQVDALFQYCGGTVLSFEDFGGGRSTGKLDEGKIMSGWYNSMRLTTAKGKFRMSFFYCSRNDSDPSNVGIRAITIILDEKVEERFTFWGNEEWDSGIRILENNDD